MDLSNDEIEKLIQEMFGPDVGVTIVGMGRGREPRPDPRWNRSEDPRVREILRLYEEMGKAIAGGDDPVSRRDMEGVTVLLGLAIAALVIEARGGHLGCLKDLYLDFLKHVKGRDYVARSLTEALLEKAEEKWGEGGRGRPDQTDWEEVIDKMGE